MFINGYLKFLVIYFPVILSEVSVFRPTLYTQILILRIKENKKQEKRNNE
jgi:hypothetical protein